MGKSHGKRRKTALPATASTDRYGSMLQRQYEGLIGTPKWARLDDKTRQSEDDLDDLSKVRNFCWFDKIYLCYKILLKDFTF